MNFDIAAPFVLPFNLPSAQVANIQHNLPSGADFYLVQFIANPLNPALSVVVRSSLKFPLSKIKQAASYKLIATAFNNGLLEGVWWVDNYVYDPDQRNIEFKSQGQSSGGGEKKTFSGSVLINGSPAVRRVIAVGIDGDIPLFLGETQSAADGRYTLEWNGYTGRVLITATDDYGVPFNSGDVRGVGERIHPQSPTGYVYEVASAGTLGAEPQWPEAEGESVLSGDVSLVAIPFYQPQTAGPVTVV